jgi:hypothetical protein
MNKKIQTEEQFLANFNKSDKEEDIKLRKLIYKHKEDHEQYSTDYNHIDYKDCLLAALEYYYNVTDYEILTWVEENGYQGDTIAVIKDKKTGQFYYCNFGWGSCSGCDTLEGEHGTEENVIRELQNDIVPVPIDIIQYVKNELQNSWKKELVSETLDKLKEKLK